MDTYYKCIDCERASEISVVDEAVVSECCEAPVAELPLAHDDGCCCESCDPSGLVQSFYARTGRVL